MDEVVQILLGTGASFNDATAVEHLPKALSWAAQTWRLDHIRMLLSRGIDFKAPSTKYGWAVLLSASKYGQLSAVRLLTDCGENINAPSQGGTAVLYLPQAMDLWMFQSCCLIEARTPSLYDKTRSAMSLAMDHIHRNVVGLSWAMVPIDSQAQGWHKALFWTEPNGFLETAKLHVARGTDINAVNDSGGTALFAAARKGPGAVNFLLDQGASVNHKNNKFSSASLETIESVASYISYWSNREQEDEKATHLFASRLS
ncbi:putative pfs domain-containing protein [Colletotrichum sublineola]|uniref:Putative pfs domain-containing protein n=1 Tax=Colletotrichum sublineola TaxID=1173701 RepID=A0A066WY19_COLSU|nr:putative pfs domain-containing protein [Colletotrichum sublineola]